jgi:hypothetical protein
MIHITDSTRTKIWEFLWFWFPITRLESVHFHFLRPIYPTLWYTYNSTDSIFGATAPKPSVPSVSPSASGATKAFASILSTPSVPAASSSKKDKVNPVALKYYSSLRGLNVFFLSAISKPSAGSIHRCLRYGSALQELPNICAEGVQ